MNFNRIFAIGFLIFFIGGCVYIAELKKEIKRKEHYVFVCRADFEKRLNELLSVRTIRDPSGRMYLYYRDGAYVIKTQEAISLISSDIADNLFKEEAKK